MEDLSEQMSKYTLKLHTLKRSDTLPGGTMDTVQKCDMYHM